MRYYIIAGERSGDLHAGNLVKALSAEDQAAVFQGFGGDYMEQAGVKLTVHYRQLAFMGFLEVVRNLRKISGFAKICKKDIEAFQPDVVILVDYAGFNMQIAKFAKAKGLKVFYYISPKVWAWYTRRALQLKRTVDEMFVILPFEKDFFARFGWNVHYVGNPVLDAVKSHQVRRSFRAENNVGADQTVIALLPGSRRQEVSGMVPVFLDVIRRCPDLLFCVAKVNNLEMDLYDPLADHSNVRIVEDDTYNLLLSSRAAIVTSGTATLETALLKVPQLVVYKTSAVSYALAKFFIKVDYISLVNLIAGREVIRELIQRGATSASIEKELRAVVADSAYRTIMLQHYDAIMDKLDIGSASQNAARLMVDLLAKK